LIPKEKETLAQTLPITYSARAFAARTDWPWERWYNGSGGCFCLTFLFVNSPAIGISSLDRVAMIVPVLPFVE
jgi:hypothetical protein